MIPRVRGFIETLLPVLQLTEILKAVPERVAVLSLYGVPDEQ